MFSYNKSRISEYVFRSLCCHESCATATSNKPTACEIDAQVVRNSFLSFNATLESYFHRQISDTVQYILYKALFKKMKRILLPTINYNLLAS